VIRLRDEWGWTGTAVAMAILGACMAVILGVAGLIWATTPRDSEGNPLPCIKSHQETTYVLVGKVVVPSMYYVCDAYGSPSPEGPK